MEKWKWFVYILECEDGTFYTGLTWKSELRYDQHVSGLGSKYTSKHKVRAIVYVEEHDDLELARGREKQIKNWSQKKKRMLISGKWRREW